MTHNCDCDNEKNVRLEAERRLYEQESDLLESRPVFFGSGLKSSQRTCVGHNNHFVHSAHNFAAICKNLRRTDQARNIKTAFSMCTELPVIPQLLMKLQLENHCLFDSQN